MSKFPNELFVYIEQDTDNENMFFVSTELAGNLEGVGDRRRIAKYQLVEHYDVELKAEIVSSIPYMKNKRSKGKEMK